MPFCRFSYDKQPIRQCYKHSLIFFSSSLDCFFVYFFFFQFNQIESSFDLYSSLNALTVDLTTFGKKKIDKSMKGQGHRKTEQRKLCKGMHSLGAFLLDLNGFLFVLFMFWMFGVFLVLNFHCPELI